MLLKILQNLQENISVGVSYSVNYRSEAGRFWTSSFDKQKMGDTHLHLSPCTLYIFSDIHPLMTV